MMVKPKTSHQRARRGSDMDDALFKALETKVPGKDTGPDPDDILAGLLSDDEAGTADRSNTHSKGARRFTIELDEADRQRAELIVKIVRERTGEQTGLAQAIKIALCVCPLEEAEIEEAYGVVCLPEVEQG